MRTLDEPGDARRTSFLEQIPIVPLYFADRRPVVEREGTLIMVDDDRIPMKPGEKPRMELVVAFFISGRGIVAENT